MVKGAAKAAEAPAAAAPLPQMGTGLNVSGNPVDNVENIHHVSVVTTIMDEADKAGFGWFQPFPGNGNEQLE
jgi:hypothetical protein